MFHVPLGLRCQSPGRGIGKKISVTPPRLRKKQSNNHNSYMRMVLRQVVAAWQEIVAEAANLLSFSLPVIASSPVDYNGERTPCNVIRQYYNVLNFMFKS